MQEKAHLHLIRYAIDKGCTFEVDDGEERFKTSKYKETVEGVEAVDFAHLFIIGKDNEQLGWALIINDVSARSVELVADYSITDFMEGWDRQYSCSGRASHG
jgi:hypothetical protein